MDDVDNLKYIIVWSFILTLYLGSHLVFSSLKRGIYFRLGDLEQQEKNAAPAKLLRHVVEMIEKA